jgi:DNA-binding PadR family transcriptional regulator
MYLSDLQKFIIKQAFFTGPQCSRSVFGEYYHKVRVKKKVITISLERLIAKGLINGYGYKTAEKLFINKVSLTANGKKEAKKLFGVQQTLPLKKRRTHG